MKSQRNTRGLAIGGAALATALVLAGCTGGGDSGETTLTFAPVTNANLPMGMWEGLAEDFEADNPGINIEIINSEGQEYISYVKTLFASGNLPDIITVMSPDFAQLGIIQSLDEKFLEPFNNYETTAIGGEYFSVPTAVQPQSLMWYNKDLFDEAGITQTPATLDELNDALEKLAGVTAVPLSITGEWTTGFQYGSLAAPLVLPETSDWYAQRNAGEVTFAGSGWEDLAAEFAAWSSSGYLGGGALSTTFDQGGQQFIAGESAIYPMGVWFGATLATQEPAFEVGVFSSPTEDGTPALSNEYSLNYGLSSATKSQEAAEKFLTFITTDADAVRPQLQGDGLFSNAIDPVTYDLQGPLQGVADLMASVDKIASYAGTGDSVPPPGFSDFVNTQTQSLILGDLDAASFVASLDQWWDENQL